MERTFQELISELLRAVKGGRNLHKRTGISPTQLEAWGRGTSPTVAKVELAAKNLGISPAALLGYEPLPYWFLEDFQGLRKPDDIEAEIEHAAYIVRMAEARAEEAKSKLFALLDRRAEVRREALRAEQDAAHEAVTEVTAPKARQRHSKGKPSLNRQTG